MSQVTWRAPDELVERVRQAAVRKGYSVNEYLTQLARAATDPGLASSDMERLRERLAQAGLLAESESRRQRPDRNAVARARRRSGRGTPLADLATDGRG